MGAKMKRSALAHACSLVREGELVGSQPGAVLIRLPDLVRHGLVVLLDGGWHLTDAGRDLVAEARQEANA